jgi:hypothetical protein
MELVRGARIALACVSLISVIGCGGGGGGGGFAGVPAGSSGSTTGTLRMALTDAPACGYDAVNVTVDRVRVNQSSSAADTDPGWSEIVLNPAARINLLSLTNGVLFELGQTPLPAGKYTQLRLVLAANASAAPLANSVIPMGGAEIPLKTPSGQQSGLKANIDIDVAANQLADFVVDFDACKSVVSAGNSGNFLLKPVLTVVPRFVSGVVGFVDASIANGNTALSLQQAGVVVKATAPDSSGHFLLQPVAPGTYTLVVTAPGRATEVITNVVVATGLASSVNLAGSALNPPASPSATLTGAVSTPTSPIDATVNVLQSMSSGVTIQVAGSSVDSVTGKYSYAVPVNAPLVAPYVAGPGTLVFTSDNAVAGKYQLAATSGAATKTSAPPILTPGAVVTTNFVFP